MEGVELIQINEQNVVSMMYMYLVHSTLYNLYMYSIYCTCIYIYCICIHIYCTCCMLSQAVGSSDKIINPSA